MSNYEIADHFSLLAKLLDIHGENSFKSKSYSSAAFTIEKHLKLLAFNQINQQQPHRNRHRHLSRNDEPQEIAGIFRIGNPRNHLCQVGQILGATDKTAIAHKGETKRGAGHREVDHP